MTGVQTCALPISFLVAAAPRLFLLTISRCGRAPSFYTVHFSLRQRPCILYCPFLVAAAPRFLYCPFLVAAAPALFILISSRCGSTPAFYTAHFSLRQRPAFFLPGSVAAAPRFFPARFLLRQRPRLLYYPVLVAAAPPL